jgi:hypothetical protein
MKYINKIVTKIKTWYEGKYVPIPSNPYYSGSGHREQPLLAKILKTIGNFWLKHWQFIISTILVTIGLYIAWLQVLKNK